MGSMRRIAGIGLASTLLLVVSACGDDDSESAATDASTTTAAATTEAPATTAPVPSGEITLYNGRNETLVGPLLEQFTADTGIEVNLRNAGSGELGAQIITEGDASPADVFFSQDAGALGAVTKEGLFETLPDDILTGIPEAYRATDGTWTGLSGRVRVFVFNPDMVADPPHTIDGLVDGNFQGQVGYAPTNASWQAFVTGLRVLRGDDGARAWLEEFGALEPKAYEGNGQVRDAVNAGEVAIGLVNQYYLYELIAAEGADNVRAENQYMAAGDPGGLMNVAGAGVLASSDNKDAAFELVRYLAGPTGQEYFAEQTFEYPLLGGIDANASLPAISTLEPPEIDLSDLDSIEATQELLAEVGLLTS